MGTSPDIVIVGGGIIGLTAAVRLREAGATVCVYDRGDFGREASWAGAGIIPPGDPRRAAGPIDKLRAIGSAEFPDFSRELLASTGIDNGYRVNGGIEFLTAEDADAPAAWAAEGLAVERWDGKQRREHEPNVAGEGGCYHLPGMAQVRNPRHLRALVAHSHRLGVGLHPHAGIEGWVREDGGVCGVQLSSGGRVVARRIVVAAGPWSERPLHDLGIRPGVRPVRGQMLLLKTEPDTLQRTVLHGKRYLVPRGDGRVLVGSTEEPDRGFEKQTTVAGLAELRAFADALVPPLAAAHVEASWAGLRPGSPDGLPFIGPVPGHESVLVAAGHFRAGIQLSLGTARLLTDLLFGRPPCVPPTAFAVDRLPDLRARPVFRS